MTTLIDTVQDQMWENIRLSQRAISEGFRMWTEAVSGFVPGLTPQTWRGDVSSTEEVIDNTFDFAERLIEAQRDFAKSIVGLTSSAASEAEGLTSSVITDPKPKTRTERDRTHNAGSSYSPSTKTRTERDRTRNAGSSYSPSTEGST